MSGKRQNLLLILCWAMYTVAYLGRYSYNSNINLIISDYGVSHADAGLVTTMFFFAYGAGQIINGVLCKRYNMRIVLPAAMLISAAINFSVWLGIPFYLIKYLWLVNGFVQSCLWSSLVLTISRYLDDKHAERAVIVMSTAVPVGTFITYGTSAFFVNFGNYKLSFLFGAVSVLLMAVIWFIAFKNVKSDERQQQEKSNELLPKHKPSRTLVILVVILGVFAVFDNLIKDGLQTWVPSILKETFNTSDSLSILLTLVLPLLGMAGAVTSVFIRRFIRDFALLSAVMYAISGIFIGVVMWALTSSMVIALISFGLVELFTHGINNVVTSMAPLYLNRSFNAGMLAGVLNGCCYVGSTVSSYLLGSVADNFGWNSVFVIFLVTSATATVIGVLYYLTLGRKRALVSRR